MHGSACEDISIERTPKPYSSLIIKEKRLQKDDPQ